MTGLEYNGCFYITTKPNSIDIEQLWFIVKNKKHENIEAYSKMWKNQRSLQCSYDEYHMKVLKDLSENVHSRKL